MVYDRHEMRETDRSEIGNKIMEAIICLGLLYGGEFMDQLHIICVNVQKNCVNVTGFLQVMEVVDSYTEMAYNLIYFN